MSHSEEEEEEEERVEGDGGGVHDSKNSCTAKSTNTRFRTKCSKNARAHTCAIYAVICKGAHTKLDPEAYCFILYYLLWLGAVLGVRDGKADEVQQKGNGDGFECHGTHVGDLTAGADVDVSEVNKPALQIHKWIGP
ncbi:hypothetical protein OsJ_11108 [Oryza sativa Japonica Group]|uniref:Uncharacterized protein n=3 Tax=Oryza TaxID=4527 RepID=A0A8J8YME1_ORYSJ|nr:expressed protein [Oryza sativa Japonica Group]EAZ27172.1 hypothetical protein OsJ_11108 [Oryza sativa Japonica Group]